MKSRLTVVFAVAIITNALSATTALGCTIVTTGERVRLRSPFEIRVTSFGDPAPSTTVWVMTPSGQRHVVTDTKGAAIVSDLPPGDYELRINEPFPAFENVRVVNEPPATSSVRLGWPGSGAVTGATLHLSRVTGRMIGSTKGTLLTLFTGITGALIAHTELADDGVFDFGHVSDGNYMLRLERSKDDTAFIPVRVTSDGSSTVELAMGWSSCGLWYGDIGKCVIPTIVLPRARGVVVDPMGAVIGRARLVLRRESTDDQAVIGTMVSDAEGQWDFGSIRVGRYILDAVAPGFTPTRFPLTVTADAKPALAQIALGVMGACSNVAEVALR